MYKFIIKYISHLSLIVCFIISCDSSGVDSLSGLTLYKGESNFTGELKKLDGPRGIIPGYIEFNHPDILKDDWTSSYEFFIFDDTTSLIILSAQPLYFLKIDSWKFRFHLENELAQLSIGITGNSKQQNTMPFYRRVGDYSVEIYCIPKELHYSYYGANKYRISDNNGVTSEDGNLDLWRFMEAAGTNIAYIPYYEDEQLYNDFFNGTLAGQKNIIYTNNVSSAFTGGYILTPINLNFAFFFGFNLSITDNLLGSEDINLVNENLLTRDYAAFISCPLGNSKSTTGSNYINNLDGIAVIIRGHDLEHFLEFFRAEGFVF